MINAQPLRIAVLAGGKSRERNISLESGDAVAKGLSERGHIVTRIDPAQIELTTTSRFSHYMARLAKTGMSNKFLKMPEFHLRGATRRRLGWHSASRRRKNVLCNMVSRLRRMS